MIVSPAAARRTGASLSLLLILLLLVDVVTKFLQPVPVVEEFKRLGLPLSLAPTLGYLLLLSTLLYAFPRTCVLGAILLTGYLGGAVVTHLRNGDPLFSHVLFPVYLGVAAWAGIFLRDGRMRELIPLRR